VCREASILGQRNRPKGSETARHSGLLNALLCAVHAGGELGWESADEPQGEKEVGGKGTSQEERIPFDG